MHESVIAQELARRIREEAEKAACKKVVSATVRMGVFSGVVPEALAFSFELFCDGILLGCVLKTEVLPLECQCTACGLDFQTTDERMRCPSCDGYGRTASGGYDLMLSKIEVE